MTNNNLLSVAEAAQVSEYSEGHIRWLIRTGKVNAQKVGERVYLVELGSLTAYIEKMRAMGSAKFTSR